MTNTSTKSTRTRSNKRGGHVTKSQGEAANVAPEGTVAVPQVIADQLPAEHLEPVTPEVQQLAETVADAMSEGAVSTDEAAVIVADNTPLTVEQSEDLVAAIAQSEADAVTEPVVQQTPEVDPAAESGSEPAPAESQTTDDANPATEAPTEAPAPEVTAAPVDIFADLPMTKIEDYEFRDLGTAETSNPRKYDGVHKAALEAKLPMKKDWKHRDAMIAIGRNKREFRPGSVYGTIEQVIQQFGRAGVPAYVLVSKVRQMQIGNKRSHYCTALPPIGWAEGWIDTFVSKNHGRVMDKKAPAITVEEVKEIVADEAEAERKAA